MKCDLEPTPLSRLLTIYNFLNILPPGQKLAEFLSEALNCIPGVRAFNLCLRNFCGPKTMAPPPDACRTCPIWDGQMDDVRERFSCHVANSESRRIYPIETMHRVYGHALADVNPAGEYSSYEPYVRNLFHVVAVTIENCLQQSRLKAVNQKLQESRHTLQTFLDAIPESAFLIDPQCTVLAANTTTAERLGKTVQDIIGIDIHDLIPDKVARHRRPYLERALRTGLPVSFEDARGDIWVSHRISPIKDHDGNVSKIAVLGIDITDRKHAEAALQESELFFKTVIQHSPLGIGIVNSEGDMTECNEALCNLLGYKREELLQLNFSDFTHPNDLEKERALIQEMWNGATSSYQMEKRYIHKNQNIIWVNVFAAVIIEDGKMKLGFAFVEDITDRKRAEAALQKSLAEKEVLLREIHHRVKNNMQTVIGLLRMHARRVDDAHLTEIFNDCRDRIGAMSLIHEALYQSGNLSKIDFKTYIRKLCRNLARAHDAPIRRIDLTANVSDVSLDMDQGIAVGMILTELISNAFKHAFPAEESGRVAINVKSIEDGRFELTVADNGAGLPADFDIRQTSSLGLRLVEATVTRELGGTIDVESGNGARFIIRFK